MRHFFTHVGFAKFRSSFLCKHKLNSL